MGLEKEYSEVLTGLYDLHERGELGSHDSRWTDVQSLIGEFVAREVRKGAHGLFGDPLESAVIDVEGDILAKFVARRFSPRNGRDLEPMLRSATRNRLIDYFRASKSRATVGFDGCEVTWEDRSAVVGVRSTDIFGQVRERLDTFRFPEHTHVREAILAYFLTNHRYPGPSFLNQLGVHTSHRQPVYNAAVVDLNHVMISICNAD